jgi:monoterpene epsilon-lactone hydrolase
MALRTKSRHCCRSYRRRRGQCGGGLTVALINRLRDAGEELPGCAWLVSPWMDLTMSGETLATKDAADPIIHKGYLGALADAYLPAGTDRKDPQLLSTLT